MRSPNILCILTTQWRAGAAGYADDPNARTPAVDALARSSANFVQAVTPHPFGPFARAAIFTGVPSPANGVRDYFDPLPSDARTIAHELNERGYATAFFGKWHLGRRDPAAPLVGDAHAKTIVPPEARGGFHYWEGFESGFLLNDPWLHGTSLPEPTRFAGYQSDVLGRRAADWIVEQGKSSDQPWLAVVSLEAPHPPYDAPAGPRPQSPDTLVLPVNVPRGGDAERRARADLAGYYAHIEATDRAIGALLQRVPLENTVVLFTSVHGDMHGAHGLFRKGWPHDESVRVPLLVQVPERLGGEEWIGERDELVSLIDLPLWLNAWAENREPEIPASAAQQISMPSVVRLADQCDRAWRGVRTRMRKLVLADAPDTGNEGAVWLYFDLQSDPHEMTNLAGEPGHETEIEALRSLIKTPAGG